MKKNYLEPEMEISAFSREDVITTSVGTTMSVESGTEAMTKFNTFTQKGTIAYSVLEFSK